MTARFDAFKAALHALCVEHGIRLHDDGTDYDEYGLIYAEQATEEAPAGLALELEDLAEMSPEEQDEWDKEWLREQAARKERAREAREAQLEYDEWFAQRTQRGDYLAMQRLVEADAKEQRKKQMRVSTDPSDPAYIDARPRKAWCNDIEIEGWTVADEFRRVVITPEKVHNGSVRVERLPDVAPAPVEWPQIEEAPAEPPIAELPRVKQETFKGKRR